MVKRKREPNKISRRDFLKDAGFIVGGAVVGVGGTALLWPRKDDEKKAIESETPKTKVYVSQVSLSESACTGCGTCELVCALVHEGSTGPSLRRIWLDRDPINLVHSVITCQQCDYPSCYYSCPSRDKALCIDGETGARYINSDKCEPACKVCIEACPFDTSRINFDAERNVPVKCDLCKDRTEGPACVEICPVVCLESRDRRS